MLWSSDGKTGYAISAAEKTDAGTDVVLYLKKTVKSFWMSRVSAIWSKIFRPFRIWGDVAACECG